LSQQLLSRYTILITGACGFLGKHIARECADKGYTTVGIGHGSWSKAEWSRWGLSEWHESDITKEALRSYGGSPSLILHCAGSESVGFSLAHPAQDFDRTVVTTREVLEYIRLWRPGARVVLPSSASVYGNATRVPIAVSTPLHPVSPYGVNKQIAEQLCLSYAEHFGVAVAIVRLFSVYGVGLRKQLFWDACTRLSRGPTIFSGSGDETRDWLHVEDAARLMLTAGLFNTASRLVINGATGIGLPTSKVVRSIANAFGDYNLAAFSGNCRPGDPVHLVADMRESEMLGWHPNRNLEVELAKYVDWFKAGAP